MKNKVHYKRLLVIFLSISFLSIPFFVYSKVDLSEEELFRSSVETTLSPIQSYEIQYSGWMYVFPAKDADFWENQKSILQNILDKRESGELSDLEKKNWGNKSDELLKSLINDYDKQIRFFAE